MCDRGMVPRRSHWELTPKQSIELECARRGRGQLVSGCVALLRRQDVDDGLVIALGGPVAQGARQRAQAASPVLAASLGCQRPVARLR